MTWQQAIILGIVQGLTEFLPVSSSGHLVLFSQWFSLNDKSVFFETVVHLGSLLAVILYFGNKLWHESKRVWVYVAAATIPAVFAGLILEPMIEQLFASLTIVALGWIITGLILLSVRHLSPDRRLNELSLKQAVIIGLVQAAAIVPGISRSGSTIGAGLMSGLTPEKAFNFSFHLSIPAILGAFVLQLKTVFENNIPIAWVPITLGWFAATVSGYVALTVLQRLVTSKRLYLFGYYCLAIGVITLILYVLPW